MERWHEPDQPRHPLTGLVCALERAGGPVLVCAADMPFVTAATLRRVAAARGAAAACVGRADGRLQPLLAAYAPAALEILRAAEEDAPLTATVGEPLSSAARCAGRRHGGLCGAEPLPRHGGQPADLGAGERLAVAPERLAFGTGSVAVLFHLLNVLGRPGAEVVYAFRSFEAYPIATQLSGATGVPVPLTPGYEHDLEAMLAAITPATVAVLLCTPNNPTGPALRQIDVEAFVDRVPDDVAVVLDEAYVEFVDDPAAVAGLTLLDRPNVVVLRTFSKAYGLAGLRIGYCVATGRARLGGPRGGNPFGVTTIAQAAALASLAAEQALHERVGELVVRRDGDAEGSPRPRLTTCPTPRPTSSGCPPAAHPPLGQHLRRRRGDGPPVRLRRDGRPARTTVRITVGEPEANDLVLEVAARLRADPIPTSPPSRDARGLVGPAPSTIRAAPTQSRAVGASRLAVGASARDDSTVSGDAVRSAAWPGRRPAPPTAAPSAAGRPCAGWVAAGSARPGAA